MDGEERERRTKRKKKREERKAGESVGDLGREAESCKVGISTLLIWATIGEVYETVLLYSTIYLIYSNTDL